jgi:Acyl carrier protein
MEKLHHDLKALIIEVLNLEEITPEDIDTQAPLFGDGLGLDSIDALELGLAIKNQYGIVLSSESEETKKAFYSVKTLADFISSQQ